MRTVRVQAMVESKALLSQEQFLYIMKKLKKDMVYKLAYEMVEGLGDDLYTISDAPNGRTVITATISFDNDPYPF